MTYKFTTTHYKEAIAREQAKRATTYPKILKRMEKSGATMEQIAAEYQLQSIQNTNLSEVRFGIINEMLTDLKALAAFKELVREYKLRKKLYPYFVFRKRLTPLEAEYEIKLWHELTIYWAEHFLGDKQIGIDALEVKTRKRRAVQ